MWAPTLEALSEDLDFRYTVHLLGGCNVVGVQPPITVGECRRVQAQNLEIVDELQPDAVFVSHFAENVETSGADAWASGLETFLTSMEERDIPVGWVFDSPTLPLDPVECAARRDVAQCETGTAEATELPRELQEREAPVLERFGTLTIDPLPFLCNENVCPLSSDGIFHYRDNHHVTASYAAALAPEFESFMRALLSDSTALAFGE